MPYASFAHWIRHSNSAARFREALSLVDQMDPSLKIACVEKLYRIAHSEWQGVKYQLPGHDETMADLNALKITPQAGSAAALSSDQRGTE